MVSFLVFIVFVINSQLVFGDENKPSLRQAVQIRDLVNVTCDAGSFHILLDLTALKRVFPQSSEKTIGLADATCVGSLVNSILVITTSPTTCGTSVQTKGDNHVYSNFLSDRMFAAGSNMIVRGMRWKIPITCTVPRSETFSINYKPYPGVGKRRTLSRRSGVISRDQREVRGQIELKQNLPVSIQLYQDAAMSQTLNTSPQMKLGDSIYIRVLLDQGDNDMKLVLSSCYALPREVDTTGHRYYLIKNGCVTDNSTKVIQTTNNHTDIQTQAFKFTGNNNEIYITCDVEACPVTDNSAPCQQTCQSKHQRHIVKNRDLVTVSIGPIMAEE